MAAFPDFDLQQQRDWLTGLRAGELSVFRSMFEAYTPRLCRFAQLSVTQDVAEDVVQDVLFDVWQRRETLVLQDGELTPYLFGAVRKRILQFHRHERVVQRTEERLPIVHPMGMGEAPISADAAILANDLELAFTSVLAQLTELQRSVLSLRWTHGMTYEQVAETLAISSQSARQHASRAQRVLRPWLERFLRD